MLFSFNDIIEHHDVGLDGVRLVRHNREGLAQWRHSAARFDQFASFQKAGSQSPFTNTRVAFHFVPGPALDDGRHGAIFVRAHTLGESWIWEPGGRVPSLAPDPHGHWPKPGIEAFDLEPLPEFDTYAERIMIDWGRGVRSWSQIASNQPKEIIELRRLADEMVFPGFANFHTSVDDVTVFPDTWRAALSSVGGVYLLVCPESGEQYVGSATGTGGFYARWSSYALNGHGGNLRLKARKPSNYEITILEVASPDMAPSDVVARETAWKRKLGSRAHGLNAN